MLLLYADEPREFIGGHVFLSFGYGRRQPLLILRQLSSCRLPLFLCCLDIGRRVRTSVYTGLVRFLDTLPDLFR